MLIKLGIVTTGVALLFGGTAQAVEPPVVLKPPTCSSAVKIGSPGTIRLAGTTVATVTQYEGCGAKHGLVHVHTETPFRSSVRLVADDAASTPTQGDPNQRHVWTFSRTMNDKCTMAVATVTYNGASLPGRSSRVC